MYYLNLSNVSTPKDYVLREESSKYKANERYKDNLFRFIFGREENKQNLLDLYNALNNSNYRNKDDLEINTLDNVIYMRMKNDVSFVLDNQMVLLEHQSKYNPNMPLRGFLYFAKLYETRLASEMNLKIFITLSSLKYLHLSTLFFTTEPIEKSEKVSRLNFLMLLRMMINQKVTNGLPK